MSWQEMHVQSRSNLEMDSEKVQSLDESKKDGMPKFMTEYEQGEHGEKVRPFDQLKFQPVESEILEAEFTFKNGDIIFHIWPQGYHKAQEFKKPTPKFAKGYDQVMKKAFEKSFSANQLEFKNDEDMGAVFVRARNYAEAIFARQLAIDAITAFHKGMGGVD